MVLDLTHETADEESTLLISRLTAVCLLVTYLLYLCFQVCALPISPPSQTFSHLHRLLLACLPTSHHGRRSPANTHGAH